MEELIPGSGHGKTFQVDEEMPALVMVANDSAEGWKRGLTLPSYVLGTKPFAPQSNLNRYMPLSDDERAPMLPELFMPGFPKSSTTWLYKCMGAVWMPYTRALGCGGDPAGWTADRCPKRFLLTAVSTSPRGDIRERKETFFFGGTPVKFWDGDFLEMHGPDPRAGANAQLPALWPWWPSRLRHKIDSDLMVDKIVRQQLEGRSGGPGAGRLPAALTRRLRKEAGMQAVRAQMDRVTTICSQPSYSRMCHVARYSDGMEAMLGTEGGSGRGFGSAGGGGGNVSAVAVALARASCTPSLRSKPRCSTTGTGRFLARQPTIPGGGANQCSHPGCERIARGMPASWSIPCMWTPELGEGLNLTDAYCVKSITPWATAQELNLSIVDFTPNYLCDAEAMRRIHSSALDPQRLRFIVVMRDPVMRAFSEWSMFALGWYWDPVGNFTQAMQARLHLLRECNRTLFDKPRMIEKLPTPELGDYVQKCFLQGKAMMYPQLSMYAPCVLHALRYFDREQFLFLRYEDLMRMDAASIVRLVGHFTGLHVDDRLVATAVEEGKCSPYADLKASAAKANAAAAKAKMAANARGDARPPRAIKTAEQPPRPMSFSSRSPDAAQYLVGPTGEALERFFDPFNAMLADAIGAEFRWRRKDHWVRELNATQMAEGRKNLAEAKVKHDAARERRFARLTEMTKKSQEWAGKKKARARRLA